MRTVPIQNKGTILMVTLWILAILSLLAIGIGFRTTIDLRLASYRIDSLKACEIAKAGIIYTINEMENDSKTVTDTLWECGVSLEENETFDEKFRNVKVGDGHFDIALLEDQERRINVNRASREVLINLLAGAANAGELADNIRGWRGLISKTEEAIPLASKDYSEKDYLCKNAPLDIISELLLVKDITPEMYFGQNETSGLERFTTVYGPEEFKININTIDETSLAAILAAIDLDRTAAANIAAARAGLDGDINNTGDNRIFSSIEELTGEDGYLKSAEGGALDSDKIQELSSYIKVNSDYFKIRSVGSLEGRKAGIKKTITCIVKRETAESPPHKTEIIGWFEE